MKMARKFKVGDKIRITNNLGLLHKIYLREEMADAIVIITGFGKSSGYAYRFIWKGDYDWYINEEQIVSGIINWKKRLTT